MKIEVGKTYETRDGCLVRVICTDAKDVKYPVVGLLSDTVKELAYRWTIDGCFVYPFGMESTLDLIREHVPVTYRWHNIKLAFDPSGNLIPDKCEITGAQPNG